MKWWKVKTDKDKEVYQSEDGDAIIVSAIDEGDFDFLIKLIYDNYIREIVIKTTLVHKEKMIKMLQEEAEIPGRSNFSIFLK